MPRAKVSDIEMYYEENGEGGPLLITSGWSHAERAFRHHRDLLASKYRCIRHEHRGIGNTDAPDGPYTTKMMGDDLNGLLEHLKLSNVRVLGGGGMGALVALQLAIHHPDKVRSLFLGSPAAKVDEFFKEVLLVWKELRRVDKMLWCREANLWCYTPQTYNTQTDVALGAAKVRFEDNAFRTDEAFDCIVDAYIDHDVTDDLHKIQCPTLVTTGGWEDFISGPRFAREVYVRIPGAKLHIFENTSHNYPHEAKEEWGRVTMDWLESA